jgi:hypothetical protein
MVDNLAGAVLKPEELKRISEEIENAKIKEAVEKRRKLEEHQEHLRQEFMQREVGDDAIQRVNNLVRHAAENGQREVMLFKFPAEYCTDHGRAVNNFDPSWPNTLSGFARKAHDAYTEHLKPHGYKLRAQVLNYPDGNLGEVGIFLSW